MLEDAVIQVRVVETEANAQRDGSTTTETAPIVISIAVDASSVLFLIDAFRLVEKCLVKITTC